MSILMYEALVRYEGILLKVVKCIEKIRSTQTAIITVAIVLLVLVLLLTFGFFIVFSIELFILV